MKSVSSTNPYESPHARLDRPLRADGTFRGLQPLWTKLDRFYKFYVTPDAIYAAWIGGQFHDKTSVRFQLSPLYIILIGFVTAEPIAVWANNRRRRLEEMYDAIVGDRADFLAADDRNLEITRKNISLITASARKSHWTMWTNSGILTFHREGQDALKVIVRGSRPMDAVVDDLVAAGYPVKMDTEQDAAEQTDEREPE